MRNIYGISWAMLNENIELVQKNIGLRGFLY